jgi:uncharacterized protein (TIGR03437 family)
MVNIYGQNLANGAAPASSPNSLLQLNGTSVSVVEYGNGGASEVGTALPCPVTYVSGNQIKAQLPAGLQPGRHVLTVTTAQQDAGKDTVAIMIE